MYLVDNDILQEEVWVGHDQMFDQTSGKNQFLQAAKSWIEPNKWYDFQMKVWPKMATKAWIFDSEEFTEFADNTAIINRGQTYPPYIPVAKGEHFGLAVAQTRNSEWYYDNLIIESFEETFPMQLFKFKLDSLEFPDSGPLTVDYYGVGYDPVLYAAESDKVTCPHSKVKLGI